MAPLRRQMTSSKLVWACILTLFVLEACVLCQALCAQRVHCNVGSSTSCKGSDPAAEVA